MSKIAHCDSRGPLNSLIDLLSGNDGDVWLAALKRFLRKENPWMPIGKLIGTVTLGKYPTTAKLRKALAAAGHRVDGWAKDILAKMPISKEKVDLDLFEVTVEELGFAKGAVRADIYRRAVELGFMKVPAEAGVLLQLKLGNQANGERLFIGMEPLIDRYGYPLVFVVGRVDYSSWLHAYCDYAGSAWYPGDSWVFGRSK